MFRVGERVVVIMPLSDKFGLSGYVREIEDGYVYVDYDEPSKKIIKESKRGGWKYLTGEAFNPKALRSHISYIREQKLKILGI
jgi:hypothetical protein